MTAVSRIKITNRQSIIVSTVGSVMVPVAGVEPARPCGHGILSYLLHTEYKRTQPPMEVVDGHQKARNY